MQPRTIGLIGVVALAAACATPAPAQRLVFDIPADDPAGPAVQGAALNAQIVIGQFFGDTFGESVLVRMAATRAVFDADLPAEWGIAPTQCWMVGVGVADRLEILSPSAWSSEACDHDASAPHEVEDLIAHELVHSFHAQHNPTRDFTGMDEVGWFVEGLAVYASGQLQHGKLLTAADAIAAGAVPAQLEDAWSGRYRYGVSGSMVAFIDAEYGRDALVGLLVATSEAEILAQLGLSEIQFLEHWRAWVTQGA